MRWSSDHTGQQMRRQQCQIHFPGSENLELFDRSFSFFSQPDRRFKLPIHSEKAIWEFSRTQLSLTYTSISINGRCGHDLTKWVHSNVPQSAAHTSDCSHWFSFASPTPLSMHYDGTGKSYFCANDDSTCSRRCEFVGGRSDFVINWCANIPWNHLHSAFNCFSCTSHCFFAVSASAFAATASS